MKEKWRVTLHLTLDRDKNPADPPGEWVWSALLDLGENEEVRVESALVGMEKAN